MQEENKPSEALQKRTGKIVKRNRGRPEKRVVDVAEALKMRLVNKLSYRDIASRYGVSKQAVMRALERFLKILPKDISELTAFQDTKSQLLTAAELKLLSKIVDDKTLKGASLNNAAYAFQQVFNANRLEGGKSTENASIQLSVEHRAIAEQVLKEIKIRELEKIQNDINTED